MSLTIFGNPQDLAKFVDDAEIAKFYVGLLHGESRAIWQGIHSEGLAHLVTVEPDVLAELYANIRDGVKPPDSVPALAQVVASATDASQAKELALARIRELVENVEQRAQELGRIRSLLKGAVSLTGLLDAKEGGNIKLRENINAEQSEKVWVGALEGHKWLDHDIIVALFDKLSMQYPKLGFLFDDNVKSAHLCLSAHNGNLTLTDDVDNARETLLDVVLAR